MGALFTTYPGPTSKPEHIVQTQEVNGYMSANPRAIKKYHLRALGHGYAVGRGQRGAKRFVTQSRAFNTLPNATSQSYLVTRSIAERAHGHNMRPGNMFRNS